MFYLDAQWIHMVPPMDPQQPMDQCSTTSMLINGTNKWLGLFRGFMVCFLHYACKSHFFIWKEGHNSLARLCVATVGGSDVQLASLDFDDKG
jgi:hypothetical protein